MEKKRFYCDICHILVGERETVIATNGKVFHVSCFNMASRLVQKVKEEEMKRKEIL